MATIKYKTALTGLTKGEKPVYRFYVNHNGTIGEEAFFQRASQNSGIPPFALNSSLRACVNQLKEEARNGNRVDLPSLAAFLSMRGSFDGTSKDAREAADPKLVLNLAAKGSLKKCCQGEGFVLENVTEGATVVINNVIDAISLRDCVLTRGENVAVSVIGNGLYIPDSSDPSTGVWIANADGEVLATAEVVESSATSLECTFPCIDVEAGAYKFCVASRNGLDPQQYGVTIAKRNVTVVDSASEEVVANG